MSAAAELSRLVGLFEQAENVIETEMLRAEARGADYTAAQRRAKRAEIRGILGELLALALGGNPDEPTGPVWNLVRDAYREGVMKAGPNRVLGEFQNFGQLHQDAAEVVYENLRDRLTDAVGYVGRRIDDVFRQATLREVMAAQITGKTSRDAARGVESSLRERGIRAFSDSRGREWKLASYAKMAAHTTMREAANTGSLNRIAEAGIDLVRIIVAPGACQVCARYRDKVFSISGRDSRYPQLTDAPPFHPNCRSCQAVAFIEELAA